MFESNSKLPKIFVYMMGLLAILMSVALFFGVRYVRIPYFIAVIICAILLILDTKSDSNLTNYKFTYLLFEIVNLIAVVSVMYYENTKHTKILNVFLILVIVIEILMAIIDICILKNQNLSKKINLAIDITKLCAMVCVLTYFFGISDLYFAIFAFVFNLANGVLKICTHFGTKNKSVNARNDETQKLEDIIKSGYETEGDIE